MRRALRHTTAVALVALASLTVACGNDGPPSAAPAQGVEAVDAVDVDVVDPTTPSTSAPSKPDPSVPVASGSTASDPGGSAPTASAPAATGEPAAPVGEPVLILSRDNTFSPEVVEVAAGTEVVWRNGGRTEHDMYPVDPALDWGVSAQDLPPGSTYSHVFTEPGEYPYYCTIHGTTTRGMVGTIIVT